MRYLLIIFGSALLFLGFIVHSHSVALKELQQAAMSPTAPSLELQERCSHQAGEVFRQEGFAKDPLADFTNHYSTKMGRCFLVISNTTATGNVAANNKTLSDAFEGKVYGSYEWINSQGKKFWEVVPSECTVTLPNGEIKKCQSSDEWNELAKTYMDAK